MTKPMKIKDVLNEFDKKHPFMDEIQLGKIQYFIEQSISQLLDSVVVPYKCGKKKKYDGTQDDSWAFFCNGYNSCVNDFLENIAKAKNI